MQLLVHALTYSITFDWCWTNVPEAFVICAMTFQMIMKWVRRVTEFSIKLALDISQFSPLLYLIPNNYSCPRNLCSRESANDRKSLTGNQCSRSWFTKPKHKLSHYSDIIMSAMASQITGVSIVYSTVYSKLHVNGLCVGNFARTKAGNTETVSIWWRHHGVRKTAIHCLEFSNLMSSSRPSDATCRQRSGSTLTQIMACCLTVLSHYLHQSLLIIDEARWQSLGDNFKRKKLGLKTPYLKFHSKFPGANVLR